MAWSTALGRGDFNSAQLKYSKSDKAIWLKPASHSFLTRLTRNGQKDKKTDVEFSTFSRPYPVFSGALWGYSAGSKAALLAADTAFYIANASTILRIGDMLKVSGWQPNNTGTHTQEGEFIRITGTPGTNYATGVRNIYSGTAVANTASGGTGLIWQNMSSAEAMGSNSRTANGSTLGENTNYVRSFCEPYAIIDLAQDIDKFGPDELEMMREDSMTRISDAAERMMFYGIKAKQTDAVSGQPVYHSGGLWYFLNLTDTEEGVAAWTEGTTGTDLVLGDGTSRIWMAQDSFSIDNVAKYVELAFLYGSPKKTGYHGRSFLRLWDRLWGNTILREPTIVDYGMSVNSHTVNGNKIEFVYAPALDAEDPTGMVLVDEPYTAIAVINDIHPREPAINPRTQVGPRKLEYDYIADLGFDGQFLKAHSAIRNIYDIAA
jgi:hypothetical protein